MPTAKDPETKKADTLSREELSPEVIGALRDGDHRAYEQLYYHYSSSIRRFLQVLTRSDELADDITQETFITIWEKREQIDPAKNIRTYLYTIARNATITYFNREKIKDKYYRSITVDDDASAGSDDLLIAQETELLIRIAVSRMPAMRRKVFELSRFEGWDNERIARELNISKNNVYDHIYQATKDIKEILALFVALFISQ